uniref:Uncharacterized protein n=1 Tax=Romanomermis culicivorax TaxID=13658 RepID=A0A915J0I0_ROMCU
MASSDEEAIVALETNNLLPEEPKPWLQEPIEEPELKPIFFKIKNRCTSIGRQFKAAVHSTATADRDVFTIWLVEAFKRFSNIFDLSGA